MKTPVNIRERVWAKGFTLLEMLIVILLSAMVVSLTFLYFNTFNRYVTKINKDSSYEIQVLRFESLLNYDIDRATALNIEEGNSSYLYCEGINVYYEFTEEYMIRVQDENRDTLKCHKLFFTPEYKGEAEKMVLGFELQLTDYKNRNRRYYFMKNQTSKMKFEKHWNMN